MSEEALEIAEKRREAKGKGDKDLIYDEAAKISSERWFIS